MVLILHPRTNYFKLENKITCHNCMWWFLLMQMHRFVGWLLLYSAQSALLFSPSLCTSNTSSSPRDSRKEQQACGDAGLIWESVADSAGNFWGSTGQKKRTVFSFLTNFFPFFFFFFPRWGWAECAFLVQILVYGRPWSRGCVSNVWHKRLVTGNQKTREPTWSHC